MCAKAAKKDATAAFPPVKGNPSKDIFIRILTKDLSLADAILDLADNSVDGARRQKKASAPYNGYFVHILLSSGTFCIADNCGGIDPDVAENYAFCFGTPKDREPEHGLIGEFGVGMKRAIFKMGEDFRVTSVTASSKFIIEENVAAWRERDTWDFAFKDYEPALKGVAKKDIGTKVEVWSLFEEIASEFTSAAFRSDLEQRLQEAHQDAISNGLEVKVGAFTLPADTPSLKASPAIRPGYFTATLNGASRPRAPIHVRLYAGISGSEPKKAGWYVYCNGRQIVAAEQKEKTVWGQIGDINIPKMHNQFSRFRGYAFFNCDDQNRLPWTTTKQGIDVESFAYKKLRPEMVRMTRPVIDFLNRLDQEKDLETTPLTDAVAKAHDVKLSDIIEPGSFDAQKAIAASTGPKLIRISYKKPADVVERVKEHLDVQQTAEVGEATFDYYCESEEIDVD
jgi:hypothetical protein